MMSNQLLPTGSSLLEIAAAKALADIDLLSVPLRELWDPNLCPANFLPYLAWAFSVDYWDSNWPEQVKRNAVSASYYIHRHKGTIAAIRRVVEPLGYLIRVVEWWKSGDIPGTFRLDVGVLETGITDEMYRELERLINDAKPCSRHLIGLSINLETQGRAYIACSSYSGDELTIYPYVPDEIVISSNINTAGALHLIDIMRIE